MKAVYLCEHGDAGINRAYDAPLRRKLAEELQMAGLFRSRQEIADSKASLRDVDFIFSTWGMPAMTAGELEEWFPGLKAVFYAAGTVQEFARPLLERGVRVFSAWAANAVPVAEFTLAQMILAAKGYHQTAVKYKEESPQAAKRYQQDFPGLYGLKIGILGAGKIGRLVIGMLKNHVCDVLVFDPFLPDEEAERLGVTKCGLEDIFSRCQIISNHLANNAQTVGLLDYRLFSAMRDNATFINTGRGAQVVEHDLARALREKPNRTAVLDVTTQEPLPEGHVFYGLKNVFITPHMAGSMNDEIARMGSLMYEEYRLLCAGKKGNCEVTPAMLATMA